MIKLIRKNPSCLILIISCTLVSLLNPAAALGNTCIHQARKITLTAINMPLKDIFNIINKQTGISIINDPQETKLYESKKFTINFSQTDITDVMNFLLNDNKDLTFKLKDSYITIYKSFKKNSSEVSGYWAIDSSINAISLSGRINDISGNPIPGATIKVKNRAQGAISNPDGTFRLTGISKGETIVVSAIGFESTEVGIKSSTVVISLKQHINNLDETVILAYGSTTKRFNTGNIGSVKAKDIETQPINNPLLALQGRVAGVFMEQASGLPGTGISVVIEGRNSIFNGTDPFYVIDGMPYISQLIQPNSSDITAGSNGIISGNPLNFINPSDVESIEVLKDADATAIYGSRAANGAVLITTKRGKNGTMRVDFNLQSGWGKVAHKLKLLDAPQYLAMRHEALQNDGITAPQSFDYDLNGTWDTTKIKDWQKELIGKSSQYRDMQISISGGTALTQYYVSGGYHKETTVFPGDYSDNKGSAHVNLTSSSVNKKFKIQLSALYMSDNNALPLADLTSRALTLAPVAPSALKPDGSLNWAPTASGSTTFYFNPLIYIKQTNNKKTYNLTSHAILSYDITKYLSLKTGVGYNNLYTDELYLMPASASTPEALLFVKPKTTFATSSMNAWSLEPQMEFNKDLKKSKINAIFGGTIQQNVNKRQATYATGFATDLQMRDIKSATSLMGIQSVDEPYKYAALFGRINYNLLDQYILNVSARRDGSSRFGSKNQYHNFVGVGAAWIFSQTKFFQEQLNFFSFGKLRASYGTTGNDQIPVYQYLDLYSAIPSIGTPYQSLMGIQPTRLTAKDLEWEETRKLQFGLELGVDHDRVLINVNYNRNRSSNQLIPTPLPTITGFPYVIRNFPAVVQNIGWEFTINTINIKTKNFTWTSAANLTIPKNKLVSYTDATNSVYHVGEPLSRLPVYHLAGVNDSTGLFEFADSKGNLSPDPTESPSYVYTDPKFYGGLQNSFSYKGFYLDFFFQFVKRIGPDLSMGYLVAPGMFQIGLGNQPITVLDHWKKIGDKASHQLYSTYQTYSSQLSSQQSDAVYADASFIRLKNISLSWQIPDNWKKRMSLQNLRLFVQAQNVLTITNYFGMDPESRGTGLPPLRVVTLGAQISL